MYLTNQGGSYYRGTEQHSRRAPFLILMNTKDATKPIRAIVRKVALHQCGHWMMGSARIKGHRIPISGAYGADGLPRQVSDEVFAQGVELPQWLYDEWNTGGGWNSSGSEAASMRQWATEVFGPF